MKGVYKKEIKDFFSDLRHQIAKESKSNAVAKENTKKPSLDRNNSSLAITSPGGKLSGSKVQSLRLFIIFSLSSSCTYLQAFSIAFDLIGPVITEEQQFLVNFFHMKPQLDSSSDTK